MYESKNSFDLEAWIFEHTVNQGHVCDGIKGIIEGSQ